MSEEVGALVWEAADAGTLERGLGNRQCSQSVGQTTSDSSSWNEQWQDKKQATGAIRSLLNLIAAAHLTAGRTPFCVAGLTVRCFDRAQPT
jgi:hypothetical protein